MYFKHKKNAIAKAVSMHTGTETPFENVAARAHREPPHIEEVIDCLYL